MPKTPSISLFEGILPLDRAGVPRDMIAGITLAALAIPEVMGYATIAGMPVTVDDVLEAFAGRALVT